MVQATNAEDISSIMAKLEMAKNIHLQTWKTFLFGYLPPEGIQIVKVIHIANVNFAISRFVIIEEMAFGIDKNLERKCILQR